MEEDIELIIQAEKLYHACSNVSFDLVSIPTGIPGHVLNRIFFDCEDHGEGIIERRLQDHSEHFHQIVKMHKTLADKFDKLDDSLKKKKVENVGEIIEKIIPSLVSLGEIIEDHQKTISEHFLSFPYNVPGYITTQGDNCCFLDFNTQMSKEGYEEGIRLFESLYKKFRYYFEPFNVDKLTTLPSLDPETGQDSYHKRIIFVENLLEKHFEFRS